MLSHLYVKMLVSCCFPSHSSSYFFFVFFVGSCSYCVLF